MASRPAWGDLALAAGFAGLGLVWVLGALAMPMWERETPGPGWLPFAFGAALVALAGLTALAALRAPPGPAAPPLGKPLGVLAASLAAVLGMEQIGFVPAVFLLLVALFALVERRPPLASVLVAAAVAGGLHLVFAVWLAVPLPRGVFGD